MKTPHGTEVDLVPGHSLLDWDPARPYERGRTAPLFGPCLLWPRSPISATAELLLIYINDMEDNVVSNVFKFADDTKLFRQVRDTVDAVEIVRHFSNKVINR